MKAISGIALLLLALSACTNGGPADDQPPPSSQPSVEFPTTPVPTQGPIVSEEVTFPSGSLVLHGFLFKPAGNGPFPAILYNHGSEKLPGNKQAVAEIFTNAGYVFFVPHRRGQGRSPGPYIQDELAAARQAGGLAAVNQAFISLHEGPQLDDQLAGLTYLRSLPYVDEQRVAIAGCSYGGIQALLAAEKDASVRAAVDFAGGAQSWATVPLLEQRLLTAVRSTSVPTMLLQAENDFDLTPTRTLEAELQRLGKSYKAEIFPSFGVTQDDGHSGFCFNGGAVWGPSVLAFLKEALAR